MNKKFYVTLSLIICIIIFAASCSKLEPSALDEDSVLDGTLDGLTNVQIAQHKRGDAAFQQGFTSQTGLGPTFVATSCVGCHAGDGKGVPFTTLTRFGQTDSAGNQFLQQGGPQLQNRALPGYMPEKVPAGATFSKFTPPANTGLGFIEAVPDTEILRFEMENLTNPDGVRGHPNYNTIPGYVTPFNYSVPAGSKYICRFGKKAGTYNLLQQTSNAYNQDIGITSVFAPVDVYSHLATDPEVSTHTVNDVVFYLQTLKAPIQRNADDATVLLGKQVFNTTGCGSCHRQDLMTGASPLTQLSNKVFHPYTDLLVHDMGSGLDDGYTEGNAKSSEWRTAPLWGLGLSPDAQGGKYFLLHDGRAHSIEEAIKLHGGEAAISVNRYNTLSASDKEALLKFLKSL